MYSMDEWKVDRYGNANLGSGGGRGVKEKSVNDSSIWAIKDDAIPSVIGVDGITQVEIRGQSYSGPSDMDVEKEKLNSLEDTTVTGKPSRKKLNIHTLFTSRGNGIDVVIPMEFTRAISDRFANTAYGFFLGNRVAYIIVANYVRNTWGKYGLVRSMFSSSIGLLCFQFSSIEGLDVMIENGLWFIRNNPLILKKWHPNENLLKEDVSIVLVWFKLHGVPVTAFSDDGFSSIATKLGTPLMLDSYTSDMCMQSWGRSSYARVMIELRADVELKDNIIVAMHRIKDEGHYICNVRVEYE
ncbi:putative reverse transcriptase domain-containing protein [Tanacetum coccineum]